MTVFALHIPDGFLSGEVAAVLAVVAVGVLAYGLRTADRELDEDRVPLLGVLAAFIFAVQMLNFPIAGGTSGHFLGATLAAVLLGPWLACLTMAVVLIVQCFGFADGGVTALGANIVNMGVLGALLAGFALLRLPRSPVSLAVVAWSAVMVGAAATAVQLAVSGTVPLGTALPAMLGVHALIGVGEAAITVVAVSAVTAARPDLLPGAGMRVFVALALAVAVGLAVAVAPFASSSPDGLERVAADHGFAAAAEAPREAPLADYAFPGVENERLATGLAGFAGTLAVFALAYGGALVLRRREHVT